MHDLYIAQVYRPGAIFLLLTIWIYVHSHIAYMRRISIFIRLKEGSTMHIVLQKTMHGILMRCSHSAVVRNRVHSRSSKFVLIESPYYTQFLINGYS